MGRFKADMYKQGLFLIALVFLSASVRSSPLKTAEDPPPATEKAAGGDEDKKATEAPVEPVGGDNGGDVPHKAEEKIEQAIQQMNALNKLFESIVTSLGGNPDTDDNTNDAPSENPPVQDDMPEPVEDKTEAPPAKKDAKDSPPPEKADDAKKEA